MKLLISHYIVKDVAESITEAVAIGVRPAGQTYLKIHNGRPQETGIEIDADIEDLKELLCRAEIAVATAQENLNNITSAGSERDYWRKDKAAWKAFAAKIRLMTGARK